MKVASFTVLPDTPEPLTHLTELAYNLYFSWNKEVPELFFKLDPETWKKCLNNPVRMLCETPQARLEKMAKDRNYLAELEGVYDRFSQYMLTSTWYESLFGKRDKVKIAYFCCEFGIHQCLPIYSGGLGVLAGDHMKSASDLGLPLAGVGLMYRFGYFQQHINMEGIQQEIYPENDLFTMPVTLIKDDAGKPLRGSVEMAGEEVIFQIWLVKNGRVNIYLLDTNFEGNPKHHRVITNALYDADRDIRIRQEILLGIGGVRALKLLGIEPKVFHVNEGHAAFLCLERSRNLMHAHNLSYEEARTFVWSTTVFTTHTPVPAGNEYFNEQAIRKYFDQYVTSMGRGIKDFLADGMVYNDNRGEYFGMTVLALHFSAYANGVARLHGNVSRQMWKDLFPGLPVDEVPIGHITNGIHPKTWISAHMRNLFLRYVKIQSSEELLDFNLWEKADLIPDDDLWELHQYKRKQLVEYVRECIIRQLKRRNAGSAEINDVQNILNPKILTIGFGRRFATYKRGSLFLKNIARLKQIIGQTGKEVQFLIAGKAHPADQAGKDIIKTIVTASKDPELKNRIVFLENYNLDMARHLMQGVDIWLNTPLRPEEASGTSGMKAAINGAINFSVPDGWWDEAYTPEVGWSIGQGEKYEDLSYQNQVESELLYGILEREIIPLFYDRNRDDIPLAWVRMMKSSIKTLGCFFNSHRMVQEYMEKFYMHARNNHNALIKNNFEQCRDLSHWLTETAKKWKSIRINRITGPGEDAILLGSNLEIKAWIDLNGILPNTVVVECYHGPVDNNFKIIHSNRTQMKYQHIDEELALFTATIECSHGGRYGYTVRILPGHPALASHFLPGLIRWYE